MLAVGPGCARSETTIIAVLFSTIIFAQTTVTGTVSDDNNDPIPGANIVLDAMNGTVADFDGNFTIVVNQTPPFTLSVSSVGFDTATINVTSENVNFDIQFYLILYLVLE